MTIANWLELGLIIVAVAVTTPLLGGYMAKVYDPSIGRPKGDRVFSAVERVVYRVCGINPENEQRWNIYALSLLAFSFVSVLILYAQLRLQGHLFLNPDHYKGVEPKLSFNTAVSFLTNTNWQAYGDGVMSHLSQMAGLAFHNFVSAAAGAAVAIAFIRGGSPPPPPPPPHFSPPLLLSQGVSTLPPPRPHMRASPASLAGPSPSRAIKQLGTNGGGFFNVNSAHPFENPTPLSRTSSRCSRSC